MQNKGITLIRYVVISSNLDLSHYTHHLCTHLRVTAMSHPGISGSKQIKFANASNHSQVHYFILSSRDCDFSLENVQIELLLACHNDIYSYLAIVKVQLLTPDWPQ